MTDICHIMPSNCVPLRWKVWRSTRDTLQHMLAPRHHPPRLPPHSNTFIQYSPDSRYDGGEWNRTAVGQREMWQQGIMEQSKTKGYRVTIKREMWWAMTGQTRREGEVREEVWKTEKERECQGEKERELDTVECVHSCNTSYLTLHLNSFLRPRGTEPKRCGGLRYGKRESERDSGPSYHGVSNCSSRSEWVVTGCAD